MNCQGIKIIQGESWDSILREVSNLDGESPNNKQQWIYRAIGKWRENKETKKPDVYVASSFDDAWERKSQQESQDKGLRYLYESWMLLDFKREAHHYLTTLPKPDDFLEWMALARHYGMPSRIVDFTYSFFVSAYFALSDRGRHPDEIEEWTNDEDGCILAVNLTWLKEDTEMRLEKTGLCDEQASFHNPVVFRCFAFESKEKCVVPVNPLRRNMRLARQHGLFLCPGDISSTFDENLKNTIPDSKKDVIRLIRLPASLRSEALRDLDRMNIGLHTLYADLTGWAESRRDLVHKPLPEGDDRFIKELKRAIGPNPLI